MTGRRRCTPSCSIRTRAANLDIDQTKALMDEMLAANAQYLPLFR